jgi:hypothetical protein
MQTINFLRNFFTKGIEIYSSFLSYFSRFFKKIQNWNFPKKLFFKISN